MCKSDGASRLCSVTASSALRQRGSALGFDLAIDELDLRAEVDEGQADFTRGRIRTELAQANVSGTVTLREDWGRTGYRMDVVVDRLNLPDGLAIRRAG